MESGLDDRGGKGVGNWQCIEDSGGSVHTRILCSEEKWANMAEVESSWSWVVGDKFE